MKFKDWSDFKIWCTGIYPIMSAPRGTKPLNDAQLEKYVNLMMMEERNPSQEKTFQTYHKKKLFWENPPLSKTAVNFLTKRYSWLKYNRKIAALGNQLRSIEKGNALEMEAIDMLSQLDGVKYAKNEQMMENEHLLGRCDILCREQSKIIDVKVSWNPPNFLSNHSNPLKNIYWFQMQGYLELYDVDYGEICFCLLNTPFDLVERERVKTLTKYVLGEIEREKFEEEMENLEISYNCDKIPLKRRVIRYRIDRCREIVPRIYSRVEKCREWLNDFERTHVLNKKIITLSEEYVHAKESNPESDTADVREGDEGG